MLLSKPRLNKPWFYTLEMLSYPIKLVSILIHHPNELTLYARYIHISDNFYNETHKPYKKKCLLRLIRSKGNVKEYTTTIHKCLF